MNTIRIRDDESSSSSDAGIALETLPIAACVINPNDASVCASNAAFRHLGGGGSSALVGLLGVKTCHHLLHAAGYEGSGPAPMTCDHGGACYRMRVQATDAGVLVLLEMQDTEPAVGDVNERQRLEGERTRLEDELRQLQKLDALGQLTSGIAHDFNNMLASVLGYADLALLDDAVAPTLRRYLEEIRGAATRGRDLVGKLLVFTRGGASVGEPVDITARVNDFVGMLRPMLPATMTLKTELPREPVWAIMEPVHLQQLLLNLAINARDAMGEHGCIELGVAMRRVASMPCAGCDAWFNGKFVEITVADDGPGIAPELLSQIFDPFFSTKDRGKGSGLGLSVVAGIVHDYDGHMLVETVGGQRTTFRLLLEPAQAAPAVAPSSTEETAAAMSGEGRRVLVVDDDAALTTFMATLLRRQGYQVDAFTEPERALACFAAQPEAFALSITDQAMPELSGVELTDELLALAPALPVIICTGYSDFVNGDTAADFGFAGYLQKPFSANELLRAAELALGET